MADIGSVCWFCHWGWPKAIRDIYDRAEADIDRLIDAKTASDHEQWSGSPSCGQNALEFGPAHCVWSDENFDGNFEFEYGDLANKVKYGDWLEGTLEIVKRSLDELAALPDSLKLPPNEYDGNNPSDYPPQCEMAPNR